MQSASQKYVNRNEVQIGWDRSENNSESSNNILGHGAASIWHAKELLIGFSFLHFVKRN